MPIVKCNNCGKMGFVVNDQLVKGRPGLTWDKKPCGHCGLKKLRKAVFEQDYGYKNNGDRFGVPEWKESAQK
jgi:hypothetical protein